MADYNVNMKQWNGSSFDNVLPLAFNSKALEGKSYDDIIQYAQSLDLIAYAGKYIGTGTYGLTHPTTITLPFVPLIFVIPQIWVRVSDEYTSEMKLYNMNLYDTFYRTIYSSGSGSSLISRSMRKSMDGKTIMIYSPNDANTQLNENGREYHYIAIGGKIQGDDDGVTDWLLTSSFGSTFVVPYTGRYMIELYGGGGGAPKGSYYTGGSSCQRYDSIALKAEDVINMSIASRPNSNQSGDPTTFGPYSVEGGTKATTSAGGNGAGNLGVNGTRMSNFDSENYSNGSIRDYGYGANASNSTANGRGGPGAVYLKYLGA